MKEFTVKKIALSVVVASTVALAACGGGSTPANNATADALNTMENAQDTMNGAMADLNSQVSAATNEIGAATNQAVSDMGNVTNAAAAATTNAAH